MKVFVYMHSTYAWMFACVHTDTSVQYSTTVQHTHAPAYMYISAGRDTCILASSLAGQLALWFAHNTPTSGGNLHGRVNLGEIHRLQKMVDTRESELAMKNNLLLRQEEEMAEMKGQLEQLSLQVQRKEYEARSNGSRRSQLEQAERDLVRPTVIGSVAVGLT